VRLQALGKLNKLMASSGADASVFFLVALAATLNGNTTGDLIWDEMALQQLSVPKLIIIPPLFHTHQSPSSPGTDPLKETQITCGERRDAIRINEAKYIPK
jgi:hypothetical protein